jgi:glucokinase
VTLTIGVDVGGTKVAGGVVDENGVILAQHRVDTPARDAEATTSAITAVIETMRADHDVEAVGIGIAGFVDASRSFV